jgi:hypothetical protein
MRGLTALPHTGCAEVLVALACSPFAAYLRDASAIRMAQVAVGTHPQPVDVLPSVAMGPGRGKKKNPTTKLTEGIGKAPRPEAPPESVILVI